MKKVLIILAVMIFVTIFLPLIIVFVMDGTVDNNPQGSAETLEEYSNGE